MLSPEQAYWVFAGLAVFVSALLTWQIWEHRRYARSRVANPYPHRLAGRVAVFVPCKGADADLLENLRPLFEQDHPDYELVFVVDSPQDNACRVISRLRAEFPRLPSQLVVAGPATTSGQKVHNLLVATSRLSEAATALAFVDTDVRPSRDWLRLLTQRLRKFGAATGYRWFVPTRAGLAGCLLSNINAAVATIMSPGIHHYVWGGSWAIRRDVFEAGRLREAWEGTLSDDLVATRMLSSMKQPVAFEPACMVPSPVDVTLLEMLTFLRRQLVIGRYHTPRMWLSALTITTLDQAAFWTSAAAGLRAIAVGNDAFWQPLVAASLLYGLRAFRGWLRQSASRAYLPHQQRELTAARRCDIWLGPVAGLATLGALVLSAIGRRIVWKGIVYELQSGGRIREKTQTAFTVAVASVELQERHAA